MISNNSFLSFPTHTESSCLKCSQSGANSKLEIENLKTKLKIDQLKLVIQQKKERLAS